MVPPPGLQIYLPPRVTLTFDLLTPKIRRFMSLSRGPFVPICIKIGSFVLCRIHMSVQTNEQTDGRTDEWTG